jgi:AcrR family transcriptional regulator
MKQPENADTLLPKQMQRPGGRTERVRKQVVEATVAILADEGVPGVSVESVAIRSGVARTTIYRRWGSPEALMLEALREELAPRARRTIDTGSLRADLMTLLQDVAAFAGSEQGRGIMQAVFIQRGSPVIAAEAHAYWTQRFDSAGEIVRRAIKRHELPEDTPERLLVEMAAAPIYLRLFIVGEPVDDNYLEGVVQFVLTGCGAREADTTTVG